MTYYDQIYEMAVDNYYLISSQDAADAGIPPVELAKLAHRGKLENISRGLYRLAKYVPHPNDPYATAVARVGRGAYLFGESVIAMLGLAPTNPAHINVVAPARTRKKLPAYIRLKKPATGEIPISYEGVPSQNVADAILSARPTMMDDRLREAADRAFEEGYLNRDEYASLRGGMGWA